MSQYAIRIGDDLIFDPSWASEADVVASHAAFCPSRKMDGELLYRSDPDGEWQSVHPSSDPVNSPAHYTWLGGIEVIDITEHLSFTLGNVVKYVLRADHKGKPVEDLEKAAWYLDREIQRRKRAR